MNPSSPDRNEVAVDVFNKRANEYVNKFMDVNLYADSLNIFCDSIDCSEPKVLELACGPGNITRYLLNKRSDLRITATDLAPNMISIAQQHNPEANCRLMDCRQINALSNTFDAIIGGFCLPYLSKEETEKLVQNCHAQLNEQGILYLSAIEGEYTHSAIQTSSYGDEVFTYFYTRDWLLALLDANGFTPFDIRRKTYPGKNAKTVTDVIVIARRS